MSDTRKYRFGPLEQRTIAGPLRVGQVVTGGIAALLALLLAYSLRSTMGIVLAIAALAGGATILFLPFAGRTIDEWIPVALRWASRAAGGENQYVSAAPTTGFRTQESTVARAELSLPTELSGLEMLGAAYRGSSIGMLRDTRAGTYTAALAVRGGSFGLREPSEQERKLDGWGAVLASLARDGSPVRRIQWVERTIPSQGDDLAAHLQSERDRAVPIGEDAVRSYIELIESAAPATQEHEILLALQIEHRRASREIKRLGGGIEGATRVLVREAEALAERLSVADLTVHGLLPPSRYCEVIRDGFDPYGRRGRTRLAVTDPNRDGPSELVGPTAASEEWGTYRTDSAIHATYWVSSWPRSEVGPAFLAPLLMQTSVLRTVAVAIEPVPFGIAIRRAEAAQTSEEADEIQRARQGFATTARTRRRQDAVSRREDEIASGHAEMRFAGYLTVSASDEAELDRSCSEMEHAAQLSRLELQRLYGDQAAGFGFTLPLGRGLA